MKITYTLEEVLKIVEKHALNDTIGAKKVLSSRTEIIAEESKKGDKRKAQLYAVEVEIEK